MSLESTSDYKILLIARSHPYWGGVESWLSNLIEAVRQSGFNLEVLLLDGRQHNNSARFASAQKIQDYQSLKVASGDHAYKLIKLKRHITRVSPDCVMPVLSADALQAACELKAEMQYQLIYPSHEHSAGVVADLRVYAHLIDKVVCVDRLSSLYLPAVLTLTADQFTSVPACFDRHIEPLPAVALHAPEANLRIGFCGRLHPSKNTEFMLQICEQIVAQNKPYQVHWVGEPRESATRQKRIGDLVDAGVLLMIGELSTRQMPGFFADIDCLLITSISETGPIIAWEAMLHQRLLITADYLGLRCQGFLQDGVNALVYQSGDAQDCLNKLTLAAEDREKVGSILAQALTDVQQFRSFESMRVAWAEIFHEVAARAPAPRSENEFKKMVRPLRYMPMAPFLWLIELARNLFKSHYAPSTGRAEWPQYSESGSISDAETIASMRSFENDYLAGSNAPEHS